MPARLLVIDGLWRCLCPSVDAKTLSKALNFARQPASRPTLLRPISTTPNSQNQCRRALHTTPRSRNNDETPRYFRYDDSYDKRIEQSRVDYLVRVAKRNPWIPKPFFEEPDELSRELHTYPTSIIYEAMRTLEKLEGVYFSIVRLAEYLVKERGEKPNEFLYESLIRANVDPVYGSAEIVRSLVKEMIDKGIQTTPKVYHALLEVTAVHPDYVLRSSTLHDMKNRWYASTPEDSVNIIVGLLRDGQYELALEKLEESYKGSTIIPPWLYQVFVYIFGELGFHDESFQVLQHQLKIYGPNQPLSIWLFLLDVYSRDSYYTGTTYIWHRMVTPGMLSPPDGTALDVLNVASRNGDAELVTEVMRMLTERGKRLDLHHYEALIHAHTLHHDIRKALNVLCIMSKTGLGPDSSSTRSIYEVLKDSPSATEEALDVLQDLRQQFQVPIAAFNVVLEATAIHGGFNKALDLYRGVRHICAGGPDLATYHVLLAHCTLSRSMRSLVSEMETFAIRPNRATYDHLIRISAMQDDYEPAFAHLRKMEEASAAPAVAAANETNRWWMTRTTALALVRRCIQAEDGRVQYLIEMCKSHGVPIDGEVKRLAKSIQREKEKQREAQAGVRDVNVDVAGEGPQRSAVVPTVMTPPSPPAEEQAAG